jgi:hypothetical protein
MTYHVAHELLGPRAAPILGGGGVDCIRDKGLLSSFRMGYGGGLSKEGRPLAAEDGGTQRAHRPSSPLPRRRGGWRQCCYVAQAAQAAQAAVRYTLAALRRPSPTPAPDRSWSELGRFLACGCALRSFDVTSGTSLSLKEKKLALFHTRIMLFIVPT